MIQNWPFYVCVILGASSCQICRGGVHISKGPVDVDVRNGQVATFPCHNHGTQSFPYWRIGSRLYTTLSLPSQHSYDFVHQELVVSNVDVTMNNMQYQCVFTLLSGDIESSVGVLRVIGPSSESVSPTYTPNSLTSSLQTYAASLILTTTKFPKAQPTAVIDIYQPTLLPTAAVTFSPLHPSINLHPRFDDSSHLKTSTIAIVISAVLLISTISVAILCSLLAVYYCWRNQKDGANEKGSDIHTQENPAYATVERGIEMKSNSAYARVHISSSH